MDYADCIWSPHLKVDIVQLEMHREERHDWYQTLGTGATRPPTESIELAQPSVQEKTHGYISNIPYHEGH